MKQKESPEKSRVARKKEETKRKIISVAMQLFKEKGVDVTSMEQIASEVDIAKGTLYNYFPVKEAIIDEYIKRSFKERNPERVGKLREMPDTRSRLFFLFSELLEGIQEQKEIFEKYLIYRMQIMVSVYQEESERSGFYLPASEIISLGQKNREIRNDLPLHVMIELFEFAFIELVKQYYAEQPGFNSVKAVEQYVDLCINGIRNQYKL